MQRTGDWLAKPSTRITATFRVVELAADLLGGGVDVQWGEWLTGGRFAAIAVVCCPHRDVSHPCPVRRAAA